MFFSSRRFFYTAALSTLLTIYGCDRSNSNSLREKLRGSMADKEDGSSFLLEEDIESQLAPIKHETTKTDSPAENAEKKLTAPQKKTKAESKTPTRAGKKKTPATAEAESPSDDSIIEDEELDAEEESKDDLVRISERIKNSRPETEGQAGGKTRLGKKVGDLEPKADVSAVPGCPANGVLQGKAPPAGNEQWCEAPGPDGAMLKEGMYSRWDNNGMKRAEATYHLGKLDGVATTFYADGSPEQAKTYRNGEISGAWTRWNKNGNKEVEIGIEGGKRNGKFSRWDKRGVLQIQGSYQDNQRSGVWTMYSKNGSPRSKITWADGKKEGKAIFYYPNGSVMKQGNFHADEPTGQWQQFSKNGQPNLVVNKSERATNHKRRSPSLSDDDLDYADEDDTGSWKPM